MLEIGVFHLLRTPAYVRTPWLLQQVNHFAFVHAKFVCVTSAMQRIYFCVIMISHTDLMTVSFHTWFRTCLLEDRICFPTKVWKPSTNVGNCIRGSIAMVKEGKMTKQRGTQCLLCVCVLCVVHVRVKDRIKVKGGGNGQRQRHITATGFFKSISCKAICILLLADLT